MGVEYVQPDIAKQREIAKKNRDFVKGSEAVKDAKTDYFPKLGGDGTEGDAKYAMTLELALFTDIVAPTLSTLNGAIWRKDPTAELPSELEYLLDNADGKGLGLFQQGRDVTSDIMQAGAYGLLSDVDSNQQAKIVQYPIESIDLIRTGTGDRPYTKVKLMESYVKSDDGFKEETATQYRVLELIDGVYTQQIWREGAEVGDLIVPVDNSGAAFDYIPFNLVGALNNDATMDPPPLSGLTDVAISIYRVNGSIMVSAWYVGQPMLYIDYGDTSGLGALGETIANQTITFGSSKGLVLGKGGKAGLIQAESNSMASDTKKELLLEAVLIGARLVTPQGGVETAEAARLRYGSQMSTLSTVAKNYEDAINSSLGDCLRFMSRNTDQEIIFQINTEFFAQTIDAQIMQVLLSVMEYGVIEKEDVFKLLKKYGLIEMDKNFIDMKETVERTDGIT